MNTTQWIIAIIAVFFIMFTTIIAYWNNRKQGVPWSILLLPINTIIAAFFFVLVYNAATAKNDYDKTHPETYVPVWIGKDTLYIKQENNGK